MINLSKFVTSLISPMTFTQILKQFKFSISGVLVFVLIENVAWIIEPTFFGSLLDALINHFSLSS